MLESQNKSLVFAIVFSLALTFYLLALVSLFLFFSLTSFIFVNFSLSKSRRQLSTLNHCLKEYGEVLKPFIENLASLLDLS